MLKGDLTSTPLAPLLLSLAEEESTGCLHVSDAEGDEALIYFKAGLVYAVSVPGRRPQLGAKLVSSGALTPEALAEALDAQRTELQGWKLGELLVHLGFVEQPLVEAFVREQVHDAVWDLIRWVEGRWRFRKNEKTREDVAPPMTVPELLNNLRERGMSWEAISAVVHGPTAVPVLSTRGGGAPETTLDADAWSMLCKIDGERSVAELARDCGYTLFEAGTVLVTLVQAGLVDIEEDIEIDQAPVIPAPDPEPEADALYGASGVSSALAVLNGTDDEGAIEVGDEIDAIARLVSEVAASVREEAPVRETASVVPLRPIHDDQSFAASIERVSAALTGVLGPARADADPFEVPAAMRARKPAPKKAQPTAEDERRRALRSAAAAELAAAHALAEALREEQDSVRREAEAEAARLAAEEEAARVAAEEEAARLAAEEEAARVAAEEEAARVAAEEEAARLAAEEEAARLAEEEAARLAAAEEARRLAEEEARRLAAEEAARVAAEEEARRLAAEEAARVAAEEEARRLAEEEARRLAEEEARRLAAEEEARRLAEEEAARLAAEEEARRLAAEEEAARIAAEEEAARIAAEAEAVRLLAAEIAAAEDEAWSEYWVREAAIIEQRHEEERRVAAEEEDARERKHAASAVLAELAQAVAEPLEVPAAALEPRDEPEPEREPVAAGVAMANREMADTAALLRELSSLGLDDDPPSAPSPPRLPARPPQPAADKKKKKRGLFGL